jgi:hypothetical protein
MHSMPGCAKSRSNFVKKNKRSHVIQPSISQDELSTQITYRKPSPTSSPQLQVPQTSERKFSSLNMCMTFPVANETPQ